jgi:hypothetical protein
MTKRRSFATCGPAHPSRACGLPAAHFSQCRIYSRYIALQIDPIEAGKLEK